MKIIKRYDLSFGGFTMEEKCYRKVPVFENGMAQPVFPFTDGKSGEKYDAKTSDIVFMLSPIMIWTETEKEILSKH